MKLVEIMRCRILQAQSGNSNPRNSTDQEMRDRPIPPPPKRTSLALPTMPAPPRRNAAAPAAPHAVPVYPNAASTPPPSLPVWTPPPCTRYALPTSLRSAAIRRMQRERTKIIHGFNAMRKLTGANGDASAGPIDVHPRWTRRPPPTPGGDAVDPPPPAPSESESIFISKSSDSF